MRCWERLDTLLSTAAHCLIEKQTVFSDIVEHPRPFWRRIWEGRLRTVKYILPALISAWSKDQNPASDSLVWMMNWQITLTYGKTCDWDNRNPLPCHALLFCLQVLVPCRNLFPGKKNPSLTDLMLMHRVWFPERWFWWYLSMNRGLEESPGTKLPRLNCFPV